MSNGRDRSSLYTAQGLCSSSLYSDSLIAVEIALQKPFDDTYYSDKGKGHQFVHKDPKDAKQQTVRPNHGIRHSISVSYFLEEVVSLLKKYQPELYQHDADISDDMINWLKSAILFAVVGRKNTLGWRETPTDILKLCEKVKISLKDFYEVLIFETMQQLEKENASLFKQLKPLLANIQNKRKDAWINGEGDAEFIKNYSECINVREASALHDFADTCKEKKKGYRHTVFDNLYIEYPLLLVEHYEAYLAMTSDDKLASMFREKYNTYLSKLFYGNDYWDLVNEVVMSTLNHHTYNLFREQSAYQFKQFCIEKSYADNENVKPHIKALFKAIRYMGNPTYSSALFLSSNNSTLLQKYCSILSFSHQLDLTRCLARGREYFDAFMEIFKNIPDQEKIRKDVIRLHQYVAACQEATGEIMQERILWTGIFLKHTQLYGPQFIEHNNSAYTCLTTLNTIPKPFSVPQDLAAEKLLAENVALAKQHIPEKISFEHELYTETGDEEFSVLTLLNQHLAVAKDLHTHLNPTLNAPDADFYFQQLENPMEMRPVPRKRVDGQWQSFYDRKLDNSVYRYNATRWEWDRHPIDTQLKATPILSVAEAHTEHKQENKKFNLVRGNIKPTIFAKKSSHYLMKREVTIRHKPKGFRVILDVNKVNLKGEKYITLKNASTDACNQVYPQDYRKKQNHADKIHEALPMRFDTLQHRILNETEGNSELKISATKSAVISFAINSGYSADIVFLVLMSAYLKHQYGYDVPLLVEFSNRKFEALNEDSLFHAAGQYHLNTPKEYAEEIQWLVGYLDSAYPDIAEKHWSLVDKIPIYANLITGRSRASFMMQRWHELTEKQKIIFLEKQIKFGNLSHLIHHHRDEIYNFLFNRDNTSAQIKTLRDAFIDSDQRGFPFCTPEIRKVIIEYHLKQGLDVTQYFDTVVRKCDTDVAKLFIDLKIKVDWNKAMLSHASYYSNEAANIVRWLVEHYHIALPGPDQKGQTVLHHYASGRIYEKQAPEFFTWAWGVFAKSNPQYLHTPNEEGETPLFIFARTVEIDTLRTFLATYSVDLTITTKLGNILTYLANKVSGDKVAWLASNYTIDFNVATEKGENPACFLNRSNAHWVFRRLYYRKGLDVYSFNHEKQSVISYLAANNYWHEVYYLLTQQNGQEESRNLAHVSILQSALNANRLDMVLYLLLFKKAVLTPQSISTLDLTKVKFDKESVIALLNNPNIVNTHSSENISRIKVIALQQAIQNEQHEFALWLIKNVKIERKYLQGMMQAVIDSPHTKYNFLKTTELPTEEYVQQYAQHIPLIIQKSDTSYSEDHYHCQNYWVYGHNAQGKPTLSKIDNYENFSLLDIYYIFTGRAKNVVFTEPLLRLCILEKTVNQLQKLKFHSHHPAIQWELLAASGEDASSVNYNGVPLLTVAKAQGQHQFLRDYEAKATPAAVAPSLFNHTQALETETATLQPSFSKGRK